MVVGWLLLHMLLLRKRGWWWSWLIVVLPWSPMKEIGRKDILVAKWHFGSLPVLFCGYCSFSAVYDQYCTVAPSATTVAKSLQQSIDHNDNEHHCFQWRLHKLENRGNLSIRKNTLISLVDLCSVRGERVIPRTPLCTLTHKSPANLTIFYNGLSQIIVVGDASITPTNDASFFSSFLLIMM